MTKSHRDVLGPLRNGRPHREPHHQNQQIGDIWQHFLLEFHFYYFCLLMLFEICHNPRMDSEILGFCPISV